MPGAGFNNIFKKMGEAVKGALGKGRVPAAIIKDSNRMDVSVAFCKACKGFVDEVNQELVGSDTLRSVYKDAIGTRNEFMNPKTKDKKSFVENGTGEKLDTFLRSVVFHKKLDSIQKARRSIDSCVLAGQEGAPIEQVGGSYVSLADIYLSVAKKGAITVQGLEFMREKFKGHITRSFPRREDIIFADDFYPSIRQELQQIYP